MIRVRVAPSESSSARTDTAERRPGRRCRSAPRRATGPATATAARTACSTLYVSTSRVVPGPSEANCAANASRSLSCTSVNACAEVPLDGTP